MFPVSMQHNESLRIKLNFHIFIFFYNVIIYVTEVSHLTKHMLSRTLANDLNNNLFMLKCSNSTVILSFLYRYRYRTVPVQLFESQFLKNYSTEF